ncbi:MAG: HDOD domain-containing protein [Desulfobacterales bacterium]|nr:HDOD domain-containing protein [Desulfobacterales bacterium]
MNTKHEMGPALIKRILKCIEDLPPMPQILEKAIGIINDPDSSLKELADLFETDQALAMKVLRLANSVYYSRLSKVRSIQGAALVLGFNTLGEMITTACASKILNTNLEGYNIIPGSLWVHSISVAFCSKIIAKKKFPEYIDDAYLAGLIHDVGKLILNDFICARKSMFPELYDKNIIISTEIERKILGINHANIAGNLCEKWNFPKHISIAIQAHHSPSKWPQNELVQIIHTANQIINWNDSKQNREVNLKIDNASLELLMFEHSEIEEILNESLNYAFTVINSLK